MTAVRIVLVTAPSEDTAAAISRELIAARLVACVNIVPGVRSLYRWKGEVCDDREVLMIIKTETARVDAVIARVTELHPYEVPEVLAVDVSRGARPYVDWVVAETSKSDPKDGGQR